MRDIVGTWRLVTTAAHDRDGRALPQPYGPSPIGTATFTAAGRMIAALCDGRPEVPGGAPREYVSYCGDYRYDGAILATRVDGTSDAPRMGTEQVRRVAFDGHLMVLRPPEDTVDGVARQRVLTWERIAPA
ncbi:MAG: lipocalin-like domain-containing protein [Marinovum algicola]|uniref:lipocalin-like domain-containing protein n=1 Tax=Alphaproteobacteria TaxID=28211 RepID=UPI0032EC2F8E